MFNRLINNFLNKFRNKTIKPTDWDGVVFWFNVKYIAIEAILITIVGGALLSILNLLPFVNFGGIFFVISFIIAIMRTMKHKEKFVNFLEVPVGSIGIITLLGDIKGSINDDNQYHMVPGKYRDILDIIFYKDIFNIILPPTRFNNFDYDFKDVFSKDGVAIQGTHTGRPQLVDPWAWANLLLASNDENIHYKKIEDISLEGMNNSSDNLTIREILKSDKGEGDGSDNFKKEYLKELNKLLQLLPYKKPFSSDIEWEREDPIVEIDGERKYKKFYFPETGLNITFNIKTRSPMDPDMRKALAAEALSEETGKAVVIDAKAKATATAISERILANQRVKLISKYTEEIKTSFNDTDNQLSASQIKDMVEVAMDLYSEEKLDKRIIDIKGLSELSLTAKDALKLIAEKLGITSE